MIKRGNSKKSINKTARDFARSSRTQTPRNRSGQVWIETVIYTLIAFILIGLVLTFARPEIEKMQDRTILQQSTEMLRDIDLKIRDMEVPGNTRILNIIIKKGVLKLDCGNDKLVFEMESKNVYTEPGKNISDGDIIVLTEKRTDYSLVTLTRDYSDKYNLKFNGDDIVKELSQASNPYKLKIVNEGEDANQKVVLNMSLG